VIDSKGKQNHKTLCIGIQNQRQILYCQMVNVLLVDMEKKKNLA